MVWCWWWRWWWGQSMASWSREFPVPWLSHFLWYWNNLVPKKKFRIGLSLGPFPGFFMVSELASEKFATEKSIGLSSDFRAKLWMMVIVMVVRKALPSWLQFSSPCLREQPSHLSPDKKIMYRHRNRQYDTSLCHDHHPILELYLTKLHGC